MKRLSAALTTLAMIVLMAAAAPVLNEAQKAIAQRGVMPPADYSPLPYGRLVEFTPENTVILSNETDGSFCRDFSTVLKNIRLEWLILEAAAVPESVKDKNLIIVGGHYAEYTGDIIAKLMAQEETAYIQQDGHYSVLLKDSPWHEKRSIYISAGSDLRLTKKAAEEAMASILANATTIEDWYFPSLAASGEAVDAYLTQFRYQPQGDELPKEALRLDSGLVARLPRLLSAAQAAEDVERLFYLLAHGWVGYGYFGSGGRLDAAREKILSRLNEKSLWMPNELERLIYEHLSFVHDCHLNIGSRQYCGHQDFWYDKSLELRQTRGTYSFVSGDVEYRLVAVNGISPEGFLFPSLNAQGDPIYKLGVLAYNTPASLLLTTSDGQTQKQLAIKLQRSDQMLYRDADVRFGEERIGGIPVLRVRSFNDYYAEQLNAFLQAADRYKGEPYLILDIRGNAGGNDLWPRRWVGRFTGYDPATNTIDSELISKTTLMGRANQGLAIFNVHADSFEQQQSDPYWTGPFVSASRWIPNHTTLIVLTDGCVGSSGEGFIKFLWRQVENVILVGENSAGAVTFGQTSIHQLPHSHLRIQLPIKLIIRTDLAWLEERGYEPDLWVPTADALNYAVAAARAGTITARGVLPPGYFDGEVVPEKPLRRSWVREYSTGTGYKYELLAVAWLAVLTIWGLVVSRKNKLIPFLVGGVALATASFYLLQGRQLGYLLLACAVVLMAISAYRWMKAKIVSKRALLPS